MVKQQKKENTEYLVLSTQKIALYYKDCPVKGRQNF